MKNVLILGADFSPSSLPPALRIRFFANHLEQFGWHPIVLATDPAHYENAIDPENEKLLAPGLEVIRTPALPVRWTRRIGLGCIGLRSLWHHWRAISRIVRERRIDLLFIPIPPYYSMPLGRLAYERFGLPYVIDYIDPWVTDHYWKLPKHQRPPKWYLADKASRTLEAWSIRHAGHIVGVSQATTDDVADRYPFLERRDGTEIPYGAATEDMEYVRRHPRHQTVFDPNDGLFHLSYVGRGGVDLLPALRIFFEAFKLGLEREPDVFNRVRLHFVGTSYAAHGEPQYQVLPLAQELGLGEYVAELPRRVAYLDALQVLLDSHALVAFGSDQPHYTASKIFPYIMSGRPLLALYHQASTVLEILRETRAGEGIGFASPEDLPHRTEEVYQALQQLCRGSAATTPDTYWPAFERYTTRYMAERLAEAFEKALLKQQPSAKRARSTGEATA